MAFDYDKIRHDQEAGSHWATYSDLFMVLSLVFLLLYVIASLRSGTNSIKNHVEYLQVSRERDDLREQIKAYNTLKENYLQTGASQSEMKMYSDLMDKISLLKEEAKDEKEKLLQASRDNEKKEMALNKYQQLIRNVINSNMISNSRMKRRDNIIVEQDKTLEEQKESIASLNDTVQEKQMMINQNNLRINAYQKKLEKNIKQLQWAYNKNKMSKKKYLAKIENLKKTNEKKINAIELQNSKFINEVNTKNELLKIAELNLKAKEQEVNNLQFENQAMSGKIESLKEAHKNDLEQKKLAYEEKIKNEKLTAMQKILAERRYRESIEKSKDDLQEKIASLSEDFKAQSNELEKEKEQSRKLSSLTDKLKQEQASLSKDVARLQKIANSKKKIIDAIKKNLADAGIKAKVDGKSGDVIIDFGEEYFDTGKANIKPGMEKVLKKFMPSYAKSLFGDKNSSKFIKSVEIVGYASPTYKGKYVNPVSLKASNKEAVNYNMDLSYYRARSIFNYIFDTEKMKYQNQKILLPMVKVTGRSFLADGAKEEEVANMTHKEYCEKYDCKKSQRVSIRFNLAN